MPASVMRPFGDYGSKVVASDSGVGGTLKCIRSLPVVIEDAVCACRRVVPMAFAELSTHALVAHDAGAHVAAAARQARIHRMPPIRPGVFAGFGNRHTDGGG